MNNVIQIPTGHSYVEADVGQEVRTLTPEDTIAFLPLEQIIMEAFENPIGTLKLKFLAKGKDTVAIVVNDITRPTPTREILSPILEELECSGIIRDNITIIIATGAHDPHTPEKIIECVGRQTAEKYRVINHDYSNDNSLTYFGETGMGLPIHVNKVYAEASLKILTGLISPHHVAGFSGGRKSVVPGICGFKTLKMHHSFPIAPYDVSFGILEGNSFHEQAMEAAQIVGVDFIFNVILNSKRDIIGAVAGDLETAFLEGTKICRRQWEINIPRKFDVVITSPGKHPKDINLHQSQKALSVAEMLTKKGKYIILVASCPEKTGSFADWMAQYSSPEEVVEVFKKEGFAKGNSTKAFLLARGILAHEIYVVSENLSEKELSRIFLKKANTVEEALEVIKAKEKSVLDIAFLPSGADIIPIVEQSF